MINMMTKEEKQLLLVDLCARLPYGPTVQISLYRNDGRKSDIDLDPHISENIREIIDKYHALPYLRPMSSMTEEERQEYEKTCFSSNEIGDINTLESYDWLNKKMFAYRTIGGKDMFKLGIALKAPEGMYER